MCGGAHLNPLGVLCENSLILDILTMKKTNRRKLRGFLFLVKYIVFAQLYFFVILFKGTLFLGRQLTPYTRTYHQGFLDHIFKSKLEHVNPKMREEIRKLDHCLLLCNHKSWADFSVAILSTAPERVGIVSRATLALIFPFAFFFGCFIERNVIVFNRGRKDKSKMKQLLYSKIKRVYDRGIFVSLFPEGHRHSGPGTLALKHGVIRMAYQHDMTCAIVLHQNTEKLVDEKAWVFEKGLTVRCLHKGIYKPADFPTEEAFFKQIEADFKAGYQELEA